MPLQGGPFACRSNRRSCYAYIRFYSPLSFNRLPFNRRRNGGDCDVASCRAQAEEIASPRPSNEIKPAELRIVSTEFSYAPAKVMVVAGRAVTLVLDNSGAETEHELFVPVFDFRLQAKAGETARKSTVFDKPGKYEFSCDLPGHRDAGMKGTLTVGAF